MKAETSAPGPGHGKGPEDTIRPDDEIAPGTDHRRTSPEVHAVLEPDAVAEDDVGAEQPRKRRMLFQVHPRDLHRFLPAAEPRGAGGDAGDQFRPVACQEIGQREMPEIFADERADPPVRRVGWWDTSGPISASPAIRRGVAEACAEVQSRPRDEAGYPSRHNQQDGTTASHGR